MFKISSFVSLFVGISLTTVPLKVQAESLLSLQVPELQDTSQYLPSAPLASRLELSLSTKKVSVYQGDSLLKEYPVAIGRPGWETPVGQFEIKTKIEDPAWRHPFEGYVIPSGDPQNPLGKRWLGFWTDGDNWVGFHGTSASMRPSIGTAASHGCVRMFDEDIQAMYELVAVGTPVVVTP